MGVFLLRRLFDSIERWHRRRKTIEALTALDDRMLDDIGLHRSEIPTLVDDLVSPRPRFGRTYDGGKASRYRNERAGAAEQPTRVKRPCTAEALGVRCRNGRSRESDPAPALLAEQE